MKSIFLFFVALSAVLAFTGCNTALPDHTNETVNPILGDKSFVEKFGYSPDAGTDNTVRIKTHLEYVEGLLRQKNISDLTATQLKKRMQLLNLLHEYYEAGIFPNNYDYANQRKPCFIDKDGKICAVGYLVEKTAGRQLAEAINRKYKYETIYEMNDKVVDDWISNSGLTKQECAMIQPTYGTVPIVYESNNITAANGIASAVVSGFNISVCALNKIQLSKGAANKTIPIIGVASGIGQIIYGIQSYPKNIDYGLNTMLSNQSQKTLSIVNMAIGTSTILLSSWNLLVNKKPKNRATAWNVYHFQTPDNKMGLALSMTRKL